jgi:hypothetical protein
MKSIYVWCVQARCCLLVLFCLSVCIQHLGSLCYATIPACYNGHARITFHKATLLEAALFMAARMNNTELGFVIQGHDGANPRRDYELLDADGEEASSDLTVSAAWCNSLLASPK